MAQNQWQIQIIVNRGAANYKSKCHAIAGSSKHVQEIRTTSWGENIKPEIVVRAIKQFSIIVKYNEVVLCNFIMDQQQHFDYGVYCSDILYCGSDGIAKQTISIQDWSNSIVADGSDQYINFIIGDPQSSFLLCFVNTDLYGIIVKSAKFVFNEQDMVCAKISQANKE